MATFVLVQGAWAGGWCWKHSAQLLHHDGHNVCAPTLTVLGEHAHLMNPSINLDTHIDDVLGVIRSEELSEIVLCGHSYGGTVIAGVTEKAEDKISSLVYRDAFVPEDGQSQFDLTLPERREAFRFDARKDGDGYELMMPPIESFKIGADYIGLLQTMCEKHPLP